MMPLTGRLSLLREDLLPGLARAAGAPRATTPWSLSSESSMTWFVLGAMPPVEDCSLSFCSDVLRLVLSVANLPLVAPEHESAAWSKGVECSSLMGSKDPACAERM